MRIIQKLSALIVAVVVISTTVEVRANSSFGDDMPVSRALAVKMLAFMKNTRSSIDFYPREISFNDTKSTDWYDRYINACVQEGLIDNGAVSFRPDAALTLGEAQEFLNAAGKGKAAKLDINPANRDKAISYALWMEVYLYTLERAAGEKDLFEAYGIGKEEIVVLATSDNNSKLPAGNVITAGGALTYSGISLLPYIDKSIEILRKDGEILAVCAVKSDTPTLENAYVVAKSEDKITVFIGGAERSYKLSGYGEIVPGSICDIVIGNGAALSVRVFTETVTGTIKRVNSERLELSEQGEHYMLPGAAVYSTAGGAVKWKSLSGLIVGTDIAHYVVKDGKICAAVITSSAVPENIRVLISPTGFKGYVHDTVSVTSDKSFTVKSESSEISYEAGEVFSLEKNNPLVDPGFERIFIYPSGGGRLRLSSVKRNWTDNESPEYRGILEIGEEQDGYSIVNELLLEEYLYAVVPSEMPTGHGLEAAKVQAVSARSFAYNQYYQNRYHKYGANVDDSVMCQVYNNIPENENSIKAVTETAGLCLVYGGQVVSANYFSTSAGLSTNAGEVWAGSMGAVFPAVTPEYLCAVSQMTDGGFPDLRSEKNAYSFFTSTEIESYDSGFAWFRWNVEMTPKELAASIDANLKSRYDACPQLIKTLQPNGSYKSVPIDTIGTLTDIEVTKRGAGGNIMELRLSGTKAVIMVQTEYNIRLLLRPVQHLGGEPVALKLMDGSVLNDYGLMPSAFFVFDKQYDGGNLSNVHFFGGGMGHGVGMSQNGVKGMIDKGKSYMEILKHYYTGADVVKMMP